MNDFAPDLQRARELVAEKLGIQLANHQQGNLRSALAEGLSQVGSGRRDLLAVLADEDGEGPAWQRLASWITVGETSFFRHRAWFATLVAKVLRPLVEERRRGGEYYLRLWSAGCASGEEAYSLAMAVTMLIPDIGDWSVSVLGTDINPAALEKARRGIYGAWSLRETDPADRARHFTALDGGRFRIGADYRRLTNFVIFNLARLPQGLPSVPARSMDLIVCRNVMMYFAPDVQRRVAAGLGNALAPDGWLAASPAESSADLFAPLRPVNFPEAIFFHRSKGVGSHVAPHPGKSREKNRPEDLASAAKGGNQPAVRPREVTMARRAEGGTPPAAPSPVDQRLRRARVLADRGRLAEARVACEAVRLDHPDALDADLLLAAVCLDMGDTEAALSAVRRALFRNPVSPDAIFLEASLLFRAGDVGRARRRMRQALDGIESLPDDTVLSARSGATVSTVRQLAHAYLAGSE